MPRAGGANDNVGRRKLARHRHARATRARLKMARLGIAIFAGRAAERSDDVERRGIRAMHKLLRNWLDDVDRRVHGWFKLEGGQTGCVDKHGAGG